MSRDCQATWLGPARRPASAALAGLALAALGALGLSACGVPVSAGPTQLSSGLLPKTLSAPLPTIPQPAGTPRGPYVTIYLLDPNNKLVPVVRTARKPVTGQEVLDTLEQGPTTSEFNHGMGTALFSGSDIRYLSLHKSVAYVALDDLFFETEGGSTALELAQIVDSLTTTLSGINSVQFYWDGAPIDTELGDGAVVLRPVTPKDYASLLQPGNT